MFELEEYTLFKLKLKQICSMQLSSTFASACYKIFTYHTLGSEKSDKHQVWLCEAFIQRARKCMSNEWHDPSKGSTKAIVAKSIPNFPPSIRFDFLGTQSQRKSLLWCWDDKITTLAYRVPWCPLPSQEPLHFSRFFDTFSHILSTDTTRPWDKFFLRKKLCFVWNLTWNLQPKYHYKYHKICQNYYPLLLLYI